MNCFRVIHLSGLFRRSLSRNCNSSCRHWCRQHTRSRHSHCHRRRHIGNDRCGRGNGMRGRGLTHIGRRRSFHRHGQGTCHARMRRHGITLRHGHRATRIGLARVWHGITLWVTLLRRHRIARWIPHRRVTWLLRIALWRRITLRIALLRRIAGLLRVALRWRITLRIALLRRIARRQGHLSRHIPRQGLRSAGMWRRRSSGSLRGSRRLIFHGGFRCYAIHPFSSSTKPHSLKRSVQFTLSRSHLDGGMASKSVPRSEARHSSSASWACALHCTVA